MSKTYNVLDRNKFYKINQVKMSEFAISKKRDKKGLKKVIFKDRSGIQIYVNSKVTKT